jgi:hypothetical protein
MVGRTLRYTLLCVCYVESQPETRISAHQQARKSSLMMTQTWGGRKNKKVLKISASFGYL